MPTIANGPCDVVIHPNNGHLLMHFLLSVWLLVMFLSQNRIHPNTIGIGRESYKIPRKATLNPRASQTVGCKQWAVKDEVNGGAHHRERIYDRVQRRILTIDGWCLSWARISISCVLLVWGLVRIGCRAPGAGDVGKGPTMLPIRSTGWCQRHGSWALRRYESTQ